MAGSGKRINLSQAVTETQQVSAAITAALLLIFQREHLFPKQGSCIDNKAVFKKKKKKEKYKNKK